MTHGALRSAGRKALLAVGGGGGGFDTASVGLETRPERATRVVAGHRREKEGPAPRRSRRPGGFLGFMLRACSSVPGLDSHPKGLHCHLSLRRYDWSLQDGLQEFPIIFSGPVPGGLGIASLEALSIILNLPGPSPSASQASPKLGG